MMHRTNQLTDQTGYVLILLRFALVDIYSASMKSCRCTLNTWVYFVHFGQRSDVTPVRFQFSCFESEAKCAHQNRMQGNYFLTDTSRSIVMYTKKQNYKWPLVRPSENNIEMNFSPNMCYSME